MGEIVPTSQFKRDYKKRARETGLDEILTIALEKLIEGDVLPPKFCDHLLKGGYAGCRECHLKPDLLLIYLRTPGEIRLIRLGSHSDLFA